MPDERRDDSMEQALHVKGGIECAQAAMRTLNGFGVEQEAALRGARGALSTALEMMMRYVALRRATK